MHLPTVVRSKCFNILTAERPRVRRATDSFEAKHTFEQFSFVENYKKEYYIANERWPDQADVTNALDAKVREHVSTFYSCIVK